MSERIARLEVQYALMIGERAKEKAEMEGKIRDLNQKVDSLTRILNYGRGGVVATVALGSFVLWLLNQLPLIKSWLGVTK